MKSIWLAAVAAVAFSLTCPALAQPAKAQLGPWGFDLGGMDPSVKPGDDFFMYAGGRYQRALKIPADRPGWSLRLAAAQQTESDIHDILEQAAAKDGQSPGVEAKVGAFYASFMDEARIEALGAKPLEPTLQAIRAASSRDELARLMGSGNKTFYGSLFNLNVNVDVKQVDRYAAYISQGGLGLPDRDYYLKPEFADARAKYQAYIATILKLEGWPDAQARAAEVMALETKIAEASWPLAERRDPDKTYNAMTVAELEALAPGFAWRPYLAGGDLAGAQRVVIGEKSAFPKLAAVYAATPLDTLKAWAAFQAGDNAAPYLSKAFDDAWFELHGRTLNGLQEQAPRWKRAVRAVSGGNGQNFERVDVFGNMGWAVGELYTAKRFPPASKAKVEALVANLKAAYRARIQKLDWMSPATKAEALKKLDRITVKVGYPDKPRDYASLVIRRDDLVGNVLRTAELDWRFYGGRLAEPVDRSEWLMTPQMNNAYNGSFNDIAFPAAILTPPIFDPLADDAINYGAVGGVIGHELTHGFDDQGRKFDAEGKLRDWWAPRDAKVFDERARRLGAQYAAFEPLPGMHVNAELTMGENIADLGGVTLALEAYRTSLKGRPAPVLDGLTGDQRVFLGWAQAWRGALTTDALKKQVTSDPHSPRPFRVNGPVRNIDDWYAAFGVKPGDRLYVAPAERVRIW
ncbi:MAG TPA: M13 family metallopeptidase [Caulobacteraceae bacterium]|jgi:putative endopeptidase